MESHDQDYLQNDQYKTAANLTSRIDLHKSFSTNPYGWFRWTFDQLELPQDASVLELACGRGDLWHENLSRIPESWDLTLTDLSDGMLEEARTRLAPVSRRIKFCQADIQYIPFADRSFDAVIADHMLYYVSDKPQAFREVGRVLKPEGSFFTTTVGERHLQELTDLIRQFHPEVTNLTFDSRDLDFLLENGSAQLEPFFGEVELRRYEDSLFITHAEPLIQYINSGGARDGLRNREAELSVFIVMKIRQQGGISIYKDSGIFIARKGGRH